ncbi:MAG: ADP-heptose--LPS heptosyltransferase [Gemmataceae bacterium]|nr:ADP-heptose--LPS heptosyltransferase [Gemmataceae bacterium]
MGSRSEQGSGPGLPRKVVVFRALKLGDLLCAVPALRALQASLPDAEIVLVGLPWAREFVDRYAHLVDGFREFPGWPGLPECDPRVDAIPAFLAGLQAEGFDLAIQMHGSGSFVNSLCVLFGARRTAGFFLPGDYCPDPDRFLPWPDRGPEGRRLLALTEFLGFPARGEELEFPLRDADLAAADRAMSPDGDYACVHPGASVSHRRWPAGWFAAVADTLARQGLRVVLTGTAGERDLTHAVAAAMAAPATDLAGETALGPTAAVLARARLLVCNDTGVSHLAAAVGTPSVVISTGDNPARWAPADAIRHRVLCRPGGWPSVREVLAHTRALLDGGLTCRPARPVAHRGGT